MNPLLAAHFAKPLTHEELMADLVRNDGAVLYWQLPKDVVDEAIADGLCYIADDDCLVHRDAIKIGDGAYAMKAEG